MSEGNGTMSYSPSMLNVKKGEQIEFIVTTARSPMNSYSPTPRSISSMRR